MSNLVAEEAVRDTQTGVSLKTKLGQIWDSISGKSKVTPTLTSGTKIADVESGGSVVPLYTKSYDQDIADIRAEIDGVESRLSEI